MTQEQKMQKVVESAGECWHEGQRPDKWDQIFCSCGTWQHCNPESHTNPSPTDLNELFRLAETLGIYAGSWKIDSETGWYYWLLNTKDDKRQAITTADTPAEALLNALYEATS